MNKQLIKLIDAVDIVSFDVFDTLVFRAKYGIQDIFIKTAIRIGIDGERFLNSRMAAEKKAMRGNDNKPVNIEQIYQYVDCQGVSADVVIKNELEIELENLERNVEVYKVYEYCLNKQKKLIVTSDMYIHKSNIISMLEGYGYSGFDQVFASSDCQKSKYRGDLFEEIKGHYPTKRILHIGDAKRSDYLNARMHGLYAFRYKADYSRCKYYAIGYRKFGYFYNQFKTWIDNKLQESEYDHIFFLSREGMFLKQLHAIDRTVDNTQYLYVSRRSLTVPRLIHYNKYEELESIIVFSSAFTAKTFLSRLGIEKSEEEIYKKAGILPEQIFYRKMYKNDVHLRTLYELFYDEIISNAKKEWNNLIKYLLDNKFEGKVAIVDIGWNGTMQNALQNIINESELQVSQLDGYYLGVNSTNIPQGGSHGFLYENASDDNSIRVAGSYGVLELITLAHHGSVKCYSHSNENVPVLYKYDDNEIVKSQLEKIDDIQEGILDYVNQHRNNVVKPIKDSGWDILVKPSNLDVRLLGELPFFDSEFSLLINALPIKKYIVCPRKFKEDFFLSVWKVGFLKKVFKLKFPYYNIYKMLRK